MRQHDIAHLDRHLNVAKTYCSLIEDDILGKKFDFPVIKKSYVVNLASKAAKKLTAL